jgi:hypothetical protein
MFHSCGQSHLENQLQCNGFSFEQEENYPEPVLSLTSSSVKLYTAYLGPVDVNLNVEGDNVFLETMHNVGGKDLLVKVVNAIEHKLSENRQYNLNYLKSLSAHKISITDNKYNYTLCLLANMKIAQMSNLPDVAQNMATELKPLLADVINRASAEYPELTSEKPLKSLDEYKKIYQKVLRYNSAVDIIFNTIHYLTFLYKVTGMISVNKLESLVSISNIPDLDNAFFNGQQMMYGLGKTMFYPLTAIDVVAHELSHGLVAGTADLEYKGHSGALNESFADIMGTMFEFYMYDTFPNLTGKADWEVGEDLGMTMKQLRSFENPLSCKQPSAYKGSYYCNPNGPSDNGGVHINSGITNYCFYLASQQKDKFDVLRIFMDCLKSLNKTSNFIHFRDTLKKVSNNDSSIINALNTVGLHDSVVSDYGVQALPQQPIPQQPIPQQPIPQQPIPQQPIPQQPIPQQPIPQRQPQQPFPQQPFPQQPFPYPRQQPFPQQPFPQQPFPYPRQQPFPQQPFPQQPFPYPRQQPFPQQPFPYPRQQYTSFLPEQSDYMEEYFFQNPNYLYGWY